MESIESESVVRRAPDNVESYTWHKLSRIHDLGPRLLDCATDFYGELGVYESWDEFWCFMDDPPLFCIDNPAFSSYAHFFIYLWRPDLESEVPASSRSSHLSFASHVLDNGAEALTAFEKRIVSAAAHAQFSFFEVLEVTARKSVVVRDLFLNKVSLVHEREGSTQFRVNDLLFGRLISVNEITIFYPLMPLVFPHFRKLEILDLKKELFGKKSTVSAEDLFECDFELRELCHVFAGPTLR